MRKTAMILFFFSLIATASAQKVQLGMKFNPNLGWFKVDDETNIESKGIGLGFSYGLIFDYNFTEKIALNIEPSHLFYNPSTEAIDTANNNARISVKWNIRYIEIPIALKMKTSQMGKFKYYGRAGISPAFSTTAKIDDNKSNSSVTAIDLSVIMGGGLYYPLGGTTSMLLGISYHNGLLRINTDNSFIDAKTLGLETFSLKNINLKSSFLSIDIGILF